MNAEELVELIRNILTDWNYGPSGMDRQAILAIHELVGDNVNTLDTE